MPLPPALAARLAKRGLIQRGEIEEKTGVHVLIFNSPVVLPYQI